MSSTRNYGPTPGSSLPAQLIPAASTAELMVLSAAPQFTSSPANVQNPVGPQALQVPIPASSLLEQQPFDFLVSGYITTGADGTVTLKAYAGLASISTTPGSNTLLKTSGAVTQNTTTAPFIAQCRLIYDSVSGKLTGTAKFLINNTVVAETAITNVLTGISDLNNPVVCFGISAQFSVANAGNLVNIPENGMGINY